MRELSAAVLTQLCRSLPLVPRVVVGGNNAVPWQLLGMVDGHLERYRLFMLNAPHGIPCRPGVVLETPFVGPGMRGQAGLSYIPSRLSQVPRLFAGALPPDLVLLHTTPASGGKVSLGIEVNLLRAAIEAARRRGVPVVAQTNPFMPYTQGDAELDVADIDAFLPVSEPLPS